jgi:hypothetical protein
MFRIRQRGIRELQNELSRGLEAVADAVMDRADVPVLTGRTRETLHTDKSHSGEWPKPATFVSTASGYGFFLHEGTSDTAAQPFLSQALDSVRPDIPRIIRSKT